MHELTGSLRQEPENPWRSRLENTVRLENTTRASDKDTRWRSTHRDDRAYSHADYRADSHADDRADSHADDRADSHPDNLADSHADDRVDSHPDDRVDSHADDLGSSRGGVSPQRRQRMRRGHADRGGRVKTDRKNNQKKEPADLIQQHHPAVRHLKTANTEAPYIADAMASYAADTEASRRKHTPERRVGRARTPQRKEGRAVTPTRILTGADTATASRRGRQSRDANQQSTAGIDDESSAATLRKMRARADYQERTGLGSRDESPVSSPEAWRQKVIDSPPTVVPTDSLLEAIGGRGTLGESDAKRVDTRTGMSEQVAPCGAEWC